MFSNWFSIFFFVLFWILTFPFSSTRKFCEFSFDSKTTCFSKKIGWQFVKSGLNENWTNFSSFWNHITFHFFSKINTTTNCSFSVPRTHILGVFSEISWRFTCRNGQWKILTSKNFQFPKLEVENWNPLLPCDFSLKFQRDFTEISTQKAETPNLRIVSQELPI